MAIKGYWKLRGNGIDVSGNNITGTPTNITFSNANGKIGVGAGFVSTAKSYVSLGNTSILNLNSNITILCWIKTTDIGDKIVFHRYTNGGAYPGYELGVGDGPIADGKLAFYNGATWVGGNAVVNTGNWTHIGVTNDGTNTRFYINGLLDASVAQANPTSVISELAYIGTANNLDLNRLTASMCELIVDNTAYSSNKIRQIYSSYLGFI